jgi:hypothetical protein
MLSTEFAYLPCAPVVALVLARTRTWDSCSPSCSAPSRKDILDSTSAQCPAHRRKTSHLAVPTRDPATNAWRGATVWAAVIDATTSATNPLTLPNHQPPTTKRSCCGVSPCCGESHDWSPQPASSTQTDTPIVWLSAPITNKSHSLHRQRDNCPVALAFWLTVLRSHHLVRSGWSLMSVCRCPPVALVTFGGVLARD